MRTKDIIQKEIDGLKRQHRIAKAKNDGGKITINGSFGKLGSMYSKLYAPDLMLQVTLTGQLMLLMLIEQLEKAGMSVKSSNTDGVEIICPKSKEAQLEAIVFDWELSTGMVMEHGEYKALYARDVNNYVAVYEDEVKAKGVYAKPTLSKNSEYPIVFEAIRTYLFDGTPLENTLHACEDVTQFLTSRTVKGGGVWSGNVEGVENSDEYKDALTAGKRLTMALIKRNDNFRAKQMVGKGIYLGKVVRWFYATDGTTIHYETNGNKVPKSDGAYPMMELPIGISTLPMNLDYDKYLDLAVGHLADLGVEYIKV